MFLNRIRVISDRIPAKGVQFIQTPLITKMLDNTKYLDHLQKITRTPLDEIPNIVHYQNLLTLGARSSPGYFNSECLFINTEKCLVSNMCSSIVEDGNYKNIYNLSEWATQKDWYNWLYSNKRKKINDVFKDVIEMEKYDVLLPPGDNDIPLL